jgi:TolA-binding protein
MRYFAIAWGFGFWLAAAQVRAAEAPAPDSPPEERAYEVAKRYFNTRAFDLAAQEFEEFLRDYPGSGSRTEAILLRAQCFYQLGQFQPCLDALQTHAETAGPLADQYLYWQAEAAFRLQRFAQAAERFEQLLAQFPESSSRAESVAGAAFSRRALGENQRVLEILAKHDAVLAAALGQPTGREQAARAYLLLIEILLSEQQFARAEAVLNQLGDLRGISDLDWQRQRLWIDLRLSQSQPQLAAPHASNLVALARESGSAPLIAQAALLQARIQEKGGQPQAALLMYDQLVQSTNAPGVRLEAVSRAVQIAIAQDQLDEAIRRSAVLLTPEAVTNRALDELRLTAGELHLKSYFTERAGATLSTTNRLQLALTWFDQVATNAQGDLAGRAQLRRGWCLWEEADRGGGSNRWFAAERAFASAASAITQPEENALARFKWADCQFRNGNYVGAISNYQALLAQHTGQPSMPRGLFEHSQYQLLRAALAAGDQGAADRAMGAILKLEPAGSLGPPALLLFGQTLIRQQRVDDARTALASFVERFPQSPLLPEARLALAATQVREGQWPLALAQYAAWLTNHADHPQRPRIEFDRAWIIALAGREDEAFGALTNFVARYPTNTLAPLAENWLADHLRNRGQFELAEDKYQRIFKNTNWPPSELTYRAQLMAGRMAFARQNWRDARGYLTNAVNALLAVTNEFPTLAAEAWFLLGDTILHQYLSTPARSNQLAGEAIFALARVTQGYTDQPLAAQAWGRTGDCYLQLAVTEPGEYERAAVAYTNALTHARADVLTRSAASFGLGLVREKQAALPGADRARLLQWALGHYLAVVEGKILREGETADPHWTKEAGLAAGRLAEESQRWDLAVGVYEGLRARLPFLRALWDAKLALAQTNQVRLQLPAAETPRARQ